MGIFDRIADQLGDLIAPIDVRAHVERGAELLARGDAAEAARELSLALSQRPDHARAALLLGEAQLVLGDVAAAQRTLEQAIALRPDVGDAHVALGDAERQLGHTAQASESYRRALEAGLAETEARARAYLGLAESHLRLGRVDRAVRELRKAVAASPPVGRAPRQPVAPPAGPPAAADAVPPADSTEAPVAADAAPSPPTASISSPVRGARVGARAQVLLGQTLRDRGDLDGARRSLERATSDETLPLLDAGEAAGPNADRDGGAIAALAALGDVYRRLGRPRDAEASYARALSLHPESIALRLGRAALQLESGATLAALASVDAVLADAPGISAALALRARALLAADRTDEALASMKALLAALPSGDDPAARAEREAGLAQALSLSLRADELDLAAACADRLLDEHGLDGDARIAAETSFASPLPPALSDAVATRSRVALAAGAAALAAQLAARAVLSDTLEARLAHAAVLVAGGHRAEAAVALRRAVLLSSRDDTRARRRLSALYREDHEPPQRALYPLLAAAHRELLRVPDTGDLAVEAARALELLDRPLLLTVMGEFNAGKSTFVNAFVGEEVAPMGITPTTATINVLKYGAERGGRVVYLDDTVRAVPWADVGPLLRGLDEVEAQRIRYVEVLYPLESLARVNVVDTPGLNSIRPEHEATARGFIAQADAVIWLFSCRQAGTASEREALEHVRDAHKQALGVLNMIDLLDETDGVAERDVLHHLATSFEGLVVALVPFSAREALRAEKLGDPEQLRRSRRDGLLAALEERFFSRAEAIKRASAARRLRALLDEARRRGEAALATGEDAALDVAERALTDARARFTTRFVVEERLQLIADLDEVYAAASREVLDFVRPRRWAFGSNEASPADREFLGELIEQQLAHLAEGSRRRVEDELARVAQLLAAVDEREASDFTVEERRVLGVQVYERYRAFARGFLRGGRIDRFFTASLPRLDVGEHAIRRALVRDMPALDVLEAELFAPLSVWGERLFDTLAARLARRRHEEDLRRLEVEARRIAPVAALQAQANALPDGHDEPPISLAVPAVADPPREGSPHDAD